MLTFNEAREIAAAHYCVPFARAGFEDDGACLVTPQRIVDDAGRGIVIKGGYWIIVDRETGEIDEWPHLDHLDRVERMRPASATRRSLTL